MRATSFEVRSFNSAMSLSVSAIFPCMPVNSSGMRAEKSPFLIDASVLNKSRSKSLGESSVALSMPMVIAFFPFESELCGGISDCNVQTRLRLADNARARPLQ